jgi:hypothetical protein
LLVSLEDVVAYSNVFMGTPYMKHDNQRNRTMKIL